MVGAAGHLGIGVLDFGRGRGVDRSGMGLILGGQLAEAIVNLLDLIDNISCAGRVVAGVQIGIAGGVVRRFQAANRAIDAGAERGDRVARRPADDIARVGVDGAVSVGVGLGFAEGVDRVGFLLAG